MSLTFLFFNNSTTYEESVNIIQSRLFSNAILTASNSALFESEALIALEKEDN